MMSKVVGDQRTVRVATDSKEAFTLLETGFVYVTSEYHDGGKILQKKEIAKIIQVL
jgi:hypothetical protein